MKLVLWITAGNGATVLVGGATTTMFTVAKLLISDPSIASNVKLSVPE